MCVCVCIKPDERLYEQKITTICTVFNFNRLSNAFVRLTVALNQNKRILTQQLQYTFRTQNIVSDYNIECVCAWASIYDVRTLFRISTNLSFTRSLTRQKEYMSQKEWYTRSVPQIKQIMNNDVIPCVLSAAWLFETKPMNEYWAISNMRCVCRLIHKLKISFLVA